MKAIVLADIHSNAFALAAVLGDAVAVPFDEVWILGDIFGYYPWAVETFDLLDRHRPYCRAVLGNHDILVASGAPIREQFGYAEAAAHNSIALKRQRPQAFEWLSSLPLGLSFSHSGLRVQLYHGTPDNPQNGRLYPDQLETYPWFPGDNEYLFLGHTHYPLDRQLPHGGRIINPGSVGQPRDGAPAAAWGVFDLETGVFEFRRSSYDHVSARKELEKMNWDARTIAALNKERPGPF
jgi:predicted phosphodiesterase